MASGSARLIIRQAALTARVLRSNVPSAARLETALGERALHAGKSVAAEGIVLVEDTDAGEVAILGEVLDPRFGLRTITRADVDDVRKLEVAQEFGAAERADEGNVPGARDRNRRHRGRRAHGADQREHLVVLDQVQRLRHRAVGVVAVVAADELELAAVDAAPGVDLGERGDDALPHALPERGGGAFQRGGLAEQDRIIADAGLVAPGRERRRCQEHDGQDEGSRRAKSIHRESCWRVGRNLMQYYPCEPEYLAKRCCIEGP